MMQRSRSASAFGAASAATKEAVAAHRDDGGGEQFGITLRTIRFYKDRGPLAPRRVSGARVCTRRNRARLALPAQQGHRRPPRRDQALPRSCGDHGKGRVQQMRCVVERSDAAITALQARRAHIEATLAELRFINTKVRKALAAQRATRTSTRR